VISKFKQNGIIHDTHIHCKRRYVYWSVGSSC
jgi:hypothetical protein